MRVGVAYNFMALDVWKIKLKTFQGVLNCCRQRTAGILCVHCLIVRVRRYTCVGRTRMNRVLIIDGYPLSNRNSKARSTDASIILRFNVPNFFENPLLAIYLTLWATSQRRSADWFCATNWIDSLFQQKRKT